MRQVAGDDLRECPRRPLDGILRRVEAARESDPEVFARLLVADALALEQREHLPLNLGVLFGVLREPLLQVG